MTTTTDPRTVKTGRVTISATSAVKRDALVGRSTRVVTADHPRGLIGKVESIDGCRAIVRFPDGRWAYSDRTLTLV